MWSCSWEFSFFLSCLMKSLLHQLSGSTFILPNNIFFTWSYSSFHARQFSKDFKQRMSKLVQTGFCSSCKQSNPQQNKKVDIKCFIIFGLNIYCLFGMIMETNLEYTQRYTHMCCRCCKNIILMNETGFYNIEEFYQSCNFGCFW